MELIYIIFIGLIIFMPLIPLSAYSTFKKSKYTKTVRLYKNNLSSSHGGLGLRLQDLCTIFLCLPLVGVFLEENPVGFTYNLFCILLPLAGLTGAASYFYFLYKVKIMVGFNKCRHEILKDIFKEVIFFSILAYAVLFLIGVELAYGYYLAHWK